MSKKIYLDNQINDEDKIKVAKYDLKKSVLTTIGENSEEDEKNKYFINHVEFKMFNSYIMKQIDLLVCDYEKIISYNYFLIKANFL